MTPESTDEQEWLLKYQDFEGESLRLKPVTSGDCLRYPYLMWWYEHVPKFSGEYNGVSNNWWSYIGEPACYP